MGAFALLLRYLTVWQATVLAGAALAFNLYALPRIGGPPVSAVARRGSDSSPASRSIRSPSCCSSLISRRRDIVAAAWGILAVGDGMATLAGRHVGGPRMPWNREKTVAGSAAFVLFGGAAGLVSLLVVPTGSRSSCRLRGSPSGCRSSPRSRPQRSRPIPIRLDDNISVPAAAAAVLWSRRSSARISPRDVVGRRVAHAAGRARAQRRSSPVPATSRARSRCRAPSAAR